MTCEEPQGSEVQFQEEKMTGGKRGLLVKPHPDLSSSELSSTSEAKTLYASEFRGKLSLKRNRVNPFLATHRPLKIVKQRINPFLATTKLQVVNPLVNCRGTSQDHCNDVNAMQDEGNVSANEEAGQVTTLDLDPEVSYNTSGNKQRSPENSSSDDGFVDGPRVTAAQTKSPETANAENLKPEINLVPEIRVQESHLDKAQVLNTIQGTDDLDATASTTAASPRIIIKHTQKINPFLATRVIQSFDGHITYTIEGPSNINSLDRIFWHSPSEQNEVVSYTVYPAVTTTTSSHLTTVPTSSFDIGHWCGKELMSKKITVHKQKSKRAKSTECKISKSVLVKRDLLLSQGKDDKNIPQEFLDRPEMLKYWYSRYELFTKYDEGIKLDMESWYSVTQESIAIEIAQHRGVRGVIVDGFCGCGGNAIQFARLGARVIAIDIDPVKVEYAKHNARIYGVADRITFVVADFMAIGSVLKGDVVFLSPPWGGPEYTNCDVFNLETIPLNGIKVLETARLISRNIIYFLPRHVDTNQLKKLAGPVNLVEIQKHYIENRVKAITAYYGNLVDLTSKDVAKGH